MAGGGKRAGAGRPAGSGWRPKVSELRKSAVEQMRALVGSDKDPLQFVCELAADDGQDVETRLHAASIALPYLYPKLSQTSVAATHTVVKIDHSEIVTRLSEKIARLAETSLTIDALPAAVENKPEEPSP